MICGMRVSKHDHKERDGEKKNYDYIEYRALAARLGV